MFRRIAVPILLIALIAGACSSTVLTLDEGDCFNDPDSFTQVESVDTVDCAEPHDNEVYEVITSSAPSWPGDETMKAESFEVCLAAFEPFIGVSYDVSRWDIAALWPSQQSWDDADDREIICAVYDISGEQVTGTARGSAD
ncbi:septum formation family protein [bacterium]|nr:septum formation family protein [bacterium]